MEETAKLVTTKLMHKLPGKRPEFNMMSECETPPGKASKEFSYFARVAKKM